MKIFLNVALKIIIELRLEKAETSIYFSLLFQTDSEIDIAL